MSVQACFNVTLKRCRGAWRMLSIGRSSSLNLLGLVFVSDVVSLSQVDVA